jgi:Spy/CpxP family protein refolding chaperone
MRIRYIVAVVCVMFLASLAVRAEEGDKPAKKSAAASAKMVQPWSKLSDLTDEQKSKIKEIHQKANDEIKAIKEKENTDIMALLTDAQKEELKSLQEKEKADKKSEKAKKDEPAQ